MEKGNNPTVPVNYDYDNECDPSSPGRYVSCHKSKSVEGRDVELGSRSVRGEGSGGMKEGGN